MEKIFEIVSLKLSLNKSNPPQLSIACQGNASTSGWTNPILSQRFYLMPPNDGFQEFDFFAEPPTGQVSQVMTPITASHILPFIPNWLKGIRIYSKTNKKDQRLDGHFASLTSTDEAVGYSSNFSFDEAFKDALAQLTPIEGADRISEIMVTEVGARMGGFPGYHLMYLRVKRSIK